MDLTHTQEEEKQQTQFISECQNLLSMMAKALVDDPSSVEVKVTSGGPNVTIIFTIYSARSDRGKLIGKQGRTATSMRTILGAVSSKYRQRCVLDIDESTEDAA